MTYREHYWKSFKHQLEICWLILWNGVILDKGHHSEWNKPSKSWFYRRRK